MPAEYKWDAAAIERAMALLNDRLATAEAVAAEVGLPAEDRYAVLASLHGVTPTELPDWAAALSTPTAAELPRQSLWSWLIDSLFPRQPALGMAHLGGGSQTGASRVQQHETSEHSLTLTARKLDRRGETLLEVHLTTLEGVPVEGARLTWRPAPDQPGREMVTDGQGRARLSGVKDTQPERWQLELHG